MTKSKKTRKFAQVKRIINPKDPRIKKKENDDKAKKREDVMKKSKLDDEITVKKLEKEPVSLFFSYNSQLGPPYNIILDTNFINFSIQYKMDILKSLMDCLYAKCTPYITDCVVGEIEKMGHRYRLALRTIKDPRFQRLSCSHKGTYADDCIVSRVKQHRCYIVATMDKDLKRRIRKIPGVPIMFIAGHKYTVERMPDALGNVV